MAPVASGSTPVYRRVMIFIDGGYLREGFRRIYGHDEINFPGLFVLLKAVAVEEMRVPEVIRAYYYDAIIDPEEDLNEFKRQKEYFSKIEEHAVYEVKLARLKGTEKGRKQKGVDVKLAVDMVTKAFMNHYDIAIFLAGDDDFLDLVKAVKDLTDKRIYGAFYPDQVSKNLLNNLDKKQPLTKDVLDRYAITIGKKAQAI
jgi:uncharacterized LabA/DUF88 family protein